MPHEMEKRDYGHTSNRGDRGNYDGLRKAIFIKKSTLEKGSISLLRTEQALIQLVV